MLSSSKCDDGTKFVNKLFKTWGLASLSAMTGDSTEMAFLALGGLFSLD